MDDFEQLWLMFPRKHAKHPARLQWARMSAGDKFAAAQALPIHVRFWRVAGTPPEYLPHFRTWLYQRRWEDELEMPEAPEAAQWWKTTSGIEAKARQVGMTPKPGEDWHSLKARILAKERVA